MLFFNEATFGHSTAFRLPSGVRLARKGFTFRSAKAFFQAAKLPPAFRPDAVAYKILPSRSAEAAREVLGDFSGIAMADGYGVYEHLAKEGRVTFAGC